MTRLLLHSPLRLFAPAKVNLGLEVLGRRTDGYHEVVTVLETISIFDVIDVVPSDHLRIDTFGIVPAEDDLVRHALERLSDRCGVELPVSVRVRKAIPIAAGLGGGSSDAGTVLSALGALLKIERALILDIASSLGSDVPFFVLGGVALATGIGTELEPIDARGRRWYVIAVPDLAITGKTAQLYGELEDTDFTNGAATRAIASELASDTGIDSSSLYNAFQRPLWARPEVRDAANSLEQSGAPCILPSGAGPALFTVCSTFQEASRIAERVNRSGRVVLLGTSVRPGLNTGRIKAASP